MTFKGYPRPDGRVGVRNHVLVLPASVCASDAARMVAAHVPGTVTIHNQNGCSQVPGDQALTMNVLAGLAANPNVYGAVVLSLGCENCQMDLVVQAIAERTDKPVVRFIIQECGGMRQTVALAQEAARKMVADASLLERVDCPVASLIVGTECGGSDPTSGLAANPLIGEISDRLVAMGATSILSETTEFIGAEDQLAARARTPQVAGRILDIVSRYEQALALVGENVRDGNPSPGNVAGGITTLEEKSLGCIHKGGHAPVEAVYDYACPVISKGLVIMDTPGNDPSSVAGMIAGGAQIVLFSTGRGTPTGNPVAPVIKLTANRATYLAMADSTDLDASGLLHGDETLESLGDRLMAHLLRVASGQQTKAEALGCMEIAIARLCNYV